MPWVRFDDRAIDHPKFLALSASAFRLWFEGMTYCNKHLTDGLISRLALKGFRYGTRARIDELVDQRLWDAHDIGFKVHDYLEWNDNKETVHKHREQARMRSSSARSRERSENVLCGVVEERSTSLVERKEEEPDALRFLFEQFWRLYPRKVGKSTALKAWQKRKPSNDLAAQMFATLAWQKQTEDWLRERGRFVPHPATWINGGRWEDEPSDAPAVSDRTVKQLVATKEFLAS